MTRLVYRELLSYALVLCYIFMVVSRQNEGVEYPDEKQMHDPTIFLNVNLKCAVLKIS